MKATRFILIAASSLALFAGMGCAHNYGPPPPPPGPPLIQEADHNGFEMGRADGAAAVDHGFAYAPRRTPAYRDTPGYDPRFGPFGPYQNAYRNAYLRGYDRGYHRG